MEREMEVVKVLYGPNQSLDATIIVAKKEKIENGELGLILITEDFMLQMINNMPRILFDEIKSNAIKHIQDASGINELESKVEEVLSDIEFTQRIYQLKNRLERKKVITNEKY